MLKTIQKYDKVWIKQVWKYPVPTNEEIKKILELFDDQLQIQLALSFILIQGLRPIEVVRLKWSDLILNEKKDQVIWMTHLVYKPTRRRIKLGTSYMFKQVMKPIYSKWLSDLIIRYSQLYPKYEKGKIFPWTTQDVLQKKFSKLREIIKKGIIKGYDFLLDTISEPILNCSLSQYRINIYSFRRFAFTFHYYITFNKDIIRLAKVFGHTRPETTEKYYIQPPEAIGLTKEMIKKRINIDEFIHLKGKKQRTIIEFSDWKNRFKSAFQKDLSFYLRDCV